MIFQHFATYSILSWGSMCDNIISVINFVVNENLNIKEMFLELRPVTRYKQIVALKLKKIN